LTIYYTPHIYDVRSFEEAQHAIISPERWGPETEYLAENIGKLLKPTKDTVILDYGCGVGRLAKPLIERYGCKVIGTEISASMMRMAREYVDSDRFKVVLPQELQAASSYGPVADHALAVWVLQHCPGVEQEIERIKLSIKEGGYLYVVNNAGMLIPTNKGWADDGRNVRQMLQDNFTEIDNWDLPVGPEEIRVRSFVSLFCNGEK